MLTAFFNPPVHSLMSPVLLCSKPVIWLNFTAWIYVRLVVQLFSFKAVTSVRSFRVITIWMNAFMGTLRTLVNIDALNTVSSKPLNPINKLLPSGYKVLIVVTLFTSTVKTALSVSTYRHRITVRYLYQAWHNYFSKRKSNHKYSTVHFDIWSELIYEN